MPLRSVKMYGFILGFQRLVWCPKCTPASNSAFMLISVVPLGASLSARGSRWGCGWGCVGASTAWGAAFTCSTVASPSSSEAAGSINVSVSVSDVIKGFLQKCCIVRCLHPLWALHLGSTTRQVRRRVCWCRDSARMTGQFLASLRQSANGYYNTKAQARTRLMGRR